MQELVENSILEEDVIKKIRSYLPQKRDVISIERVFSALADKTRIRIVSALSIMSMKVNELAVALEINQTTLSHQLAYLRSLGVVEDERVGKCVVYAIKNKAVLSLFSCALDFIEEDSEFGFVAVDF